MCFKIVVQGFVNAVKFIAFACFRAVELNFALTVAVNTPAHAQIGKLLHFIHFLYRAVAGLTLYFAGPGVLGVAEKYVVGQVMNLCPLDGLFNIGVLLGFGVPAGSRIYLLYFGGTIYFGAVFTE